MFTNEILLTISLVAMLSGNITNKFYAEKAPKQMSSVYSFSAIYCFVATIIIAFWGGIETVSVFTLVMGVIFGTVTSVFNIIRLKALQIGPVSYTTVISSSSTVITAVSGVFFGETIRATQYIGIGFLIISFVLAVEKKNDEKKASLKWFIFTLCCFAFQGTIGILQKVHQSSQYKDELNTFLVIAFSVSCLFSLVLTLMAHHRENVTAPEGYEPKKLTPGLIGIIALYGLFAATQNKLNLYLSGAMDSAVFFPIVNGGSLILTTLAAVILFRERLTKRQWIGIAAGIVSVLFICIKF